MPSPPWHLPWLRLHLAGGYAMNDRRALGLHFVNTKNFRPEGEPLWKDAPALAEE